MASRFVFWTHGVATILERPDWATFLSHQTNVGTVVEQQAGTHGWFHIPLTTLVVMENDTSLILQRVELRAVVKAQVQIDQIDIRCGEEVVRHRDVNFRAMPVDETITLDFPMRDKRGGLAISIHVNFQSQGESGRVQFLGAGAYYS